VILFARGLAKSIDTFSERTGKIVSLLSLVLVVLMAAEALSRKVLGLSLGCSFDLSYMIAGALFMLGAAEALRRGAHLRVDMWWGAFSERKKAWIDLVGYLLFFFPTMVILLGLGGAEVIEAYSISETSEQTAWHPLLWPFKLVIPVAVVLLMIQGIAECLRAAVVLVTKRPHE
jgi:TRAP-type mannitol/chloroaromatic compound transport system permease small subunit